MVISFAERTEFWGNRTLFCESKEREQQCGLLLSREKGGLGELRGKDSVLFHSSAGGGPLETQSHQINFCWKCLWKIIICYNSSNNYTLFNSPALQHIHLRLIILNNITGSWSFFSDISLSTDRLVTTYSVSLLKADWTECGFWPRFSLLWRWRWDSEMLAIYTLFIAWKMCGPKVLFCLSTEPRKLICSKRPK